MVDLCPVWFSNVGLKTGLKKPVYGPKCPAFKWSAKSCDFTIRMLPVFVVCYRIAKCIREITSGSVMCRYLMANDLICDQINTLYNNTIQFTEFY